MKCTLNPNVKSISGKCGSMLFKTFTKRDGSKETRVYKLPQQKDGTYGYKRRTPLSEKEIKARNKFAEASNFYQSLNPEQLQTYRELYSKSRFMFNGKRYATLRGFIIAKYYDATWGDNRGVSGVL